MDYIRLTKVLVFKERTSLEPKFIKVFFQGSVDNELLDEITLRTEFQCPQLTNVATFGEGTAIDTLHKTKTKVLSLQHSELQFCGKHETPLSEMD